MNGSEPGSAERPQRLPYAAMSVALGAGGLGAAWTAASMRLGVTLIVGEVLSAIGLAVWALITAARLPVTPTRWARTIDELRHPFAGPFPAYVPVVALLLTTHYAPVLPAPFAQALAAAFAALLALICGYLVAGWLNGGLHLTDLHPGYLLPVVAGPFLAGGALATIGFTGAAIGAVGAGVFFWLSIGTIIAGRLMVGGSLPPEQIPAMSVLVTPPLTGGTAWFAVRSGEVDIVQQLLLGVVCVLMVVQLCLLPRYVRAPWSSSWWAFAFPVAALAGYAMRWDAAIDSPFTRTAAIIALVIASCVLTLLVYRLIASKLRSARRTDDALRGPRGGRSSEPDRGVTAQMSALRADGRRPAP